jgi:hypothetical protein
VRLPFTVSVFHSSDHPPSFHTVSVFAAVDQSLSDAIAKKIGAPTVAPLKVAPAENIRRFKTNIGAKTLS